MRIIIVGAGEVGFHLAERLSHESQDVALTESHVAVVAGHDETLARLTRTIDRG